MAMIKNRVTGPLQQKILWSAVIVAATLFAFFPSLYNGLINWDDPFYLNANPAIRELSWSNLAWMFSNPYMGNYHPLSMLSLALDYRLDAFNPFVFHLTNLLLHAANAVLVFFVIFNLTGRLNVSVVAGLFFGVHPLHVESVAWVSERKDVLYAFFYLFSLNFYILSVKKKERKWYWLSLLFFVFSLLSKGQAVSLAATLFLVDFFMGKKIFDRRNLTGKIPFLFLALGFGIIAILAQQGRGGTEMVHTLWYQRLLFASFGFLHYIFKLILPVSLSAFYPYPDLVPGSGLPVIFYLSLLVIPLFAVALFFSYRRSKAVFFGLGFFLLNIFLLLQLLPVGSAVMADRYAYIPSVGFCFLAGYGFLEKKLIYNQKIAYLLAVLYILTLGTMARVRSGVWQNSVTLWTDVLKIHPEVPFAWFNLGNAQVEAWAEPEALVSYSNAIRLQPGYNSAYVNRAAVRNRLKDYQGAIADIDLVTARDSTMVNAWLNRGAARKALLNYDGALADFTRVISLDPANIDGYSNRALVNKLLDKPEAALKDYNSAIHLDSLKADLYYGRALVKRQTGDTAGARHDLGRTLALNPGFPVTELQNSPGGQPLPEKEKEDVLCFKRGQELESHGNLPDAMAQYRKAVGLNPGYAESWHAMGIVYGKTNQYSDAIQCFNKAIGVRGNYFEAITNRGIVYASTGRTDEALKDFSEAIRINPDYALAYFDRALVYLNTHKNNLACAELQKAAQLGDAQAREMYQKQCVGK